MMELKGLSSEIFGMKRQMMEKSERLFKELFTKKLAKWLIMDENGFIVGYKVDDISENDWEFLALQKAIYELIEVLKWELLDWRFFPYEEDSIVLERGCMCIHIKNELLNINLCLENYFKAR